ncbi:MAG: tRNA (N6-threonylcarbamoyladenosine(37)-N6)-methyltransferase TrmO [Anaerolineae bacterium]|jgi:tRNA-Thr(GGU) m(6)t(6)A37 methyltransferase TsaA
MSISYRPIGTIYTPFEGIEQVPIQPTGAGGIRGTVEVLPEFVAGLQDLDGFSHIILLYHFHRVSQVKLTVVPFLDVEPRGVFATRAPSRPNPIGLSIVRLLGIEANVLQIENVDIVNGTPLLDIKPYVPAFDHNQTERTGWLETTKERVEEKRSDDRFR